MIKVNCIQGKSDRVRGLWEVVSVCGGSGRHLSQERQDAPKALGAVDPKWNDHQRL